MEPAPTSVEAPPPEPPAVAPYHPPPSYPPPPSMRAVSTDGRAVASLISGLGGIVLGLPLGVPGLALGPLAYFLGKSAASRIDASQGTLGGRRTATWGWVMGVIATAIGAVVSLLWFVIFLFWVSSPTTGQ